MVVGHLRRWGWLQPFFETPGDAGGGGGGGGWPDFEVPAGVGGQPPDPTGGQPPAGAQPAAPAAAAGGEPAGRQAGQPPAGQPGGQPPAGRTDLPPYRQEEIRRRDSERFTATVNDAVQSRLREMFAPALGLNQDGSTPMDPRTARIREQLQQVFPELKELLGLAPKAKDLLGLTEQAPQWAAQSNTYWQGVANRTLGTVYDGVAKLLGTNKPGAELDPELQDDLLQQFTRWVGRDQTGQRVSRYEGQDPQLVTEFLQAFSARYIDPARRQGAVTIAARGAQAARQPVQGAGGTPPAAQPPPVNNANEDEVHGRGWAVFQQLRGA